MTPGPDEPAAKIGRPRPRRAGRDAGALVVGRNRCCKAPSTETPAF